ncbi:aspartyl protease [Polychaeton citri CBS 116435]|uniref:Aspartyl protease n=1 Tax=Polychaeton citri CBS 116435 TaxID=1314669 RepID=A0A9P4UM08_9PEZI|nr:aspartyl protease [Polychaeton citri CBS 116435]
MLQVLLVSLAAVAGAVPTSNDVAKKVPVSKRAPVVERATGSVDYASYFSQLEHTLSKYHSSVNLPSSLLKSVTRRQAGKEPLQDQDPDIEYYGSGSVGATTPQTFTFDFDTGSSDIFVPGPQCNEAAGCVGSTKYDQGGQDEHNTTTVTYGSGQVSGENYFDDVTVAGLTAHHQNVISLTTAAGFSSSESNSLLGMAFSSIANSGQPTYFETLLKQGTVTTKEFAFYLGRSVDGTGDNSELALGGRDTAKFKGVVTFTPVTQQTYWQVALQSTVVNGKKPLLSSLGIDPTKGQAAIDTGTTIILAPTVATASIYSRIPGAFPVPLISGSPTITLWAYPCSANPSVAITFASKNFAIDPRDFNFGQLTPGLGDLLGNSTLSSILGDGSFCLGAIASGDLDPTQNLYVVGDTFLKNWYSIYSYTQNGGRPAVGFAKSV